VALIRRVQPANPWATSNNLSALVVFLKAMRGSDAAHVGLLTGDAILQFRTLRHLQRPQADATTQQMVNRLQKLLATRTERRSRHARGHVCGRVTRTATQRWRSFMRYPPRPRRAMLEPCPS
jgi:hypothetical protein